MENVKMDIYFPNYLNDETKRCIKSTLEGLGVIDMKMSEIDNELLDIAGGKNAYTGQTVSVPSLSLEGVMRLNPDVIVQVWPGSENAAIDQTRIRESWKEMPGINAVRDGRLYVVTGDYVVIPGPRFITLLRDFVRILHPGVEN